MKLQELCDFHIRNGEGRTALELADVAHNQNVIALLKHQIKPVETELTESMTVEEGNSSLEVSKITMKPFLPRIKRVLCKVTLNL